MSTTDAIVWVEWEPTGDRPTLTLNGASTLTVEKLPTHPSAGVFRLTGLSPDTPYSYQLGAEGLSVYTFRTLPQGGTSGSVAVVSCNRSQLYRADPALGDALWTDLHEQIAAQKVAAVLHVGDQIYADDVWDAISTLHLERTSRRPQTLTETEDWCARNRPYWEEAYRNLYRTAWSRERQIARVLSAVPNLMIWDDHDIHDGYGSRQSDFWLPHSRVFDVARQVYLEYQHPLNPPGLIVDGAFPWATRWPGADVFAMDLRSSRHYDGNPSQILGAKQLTALESWSEQRAPHDPTDPESFAATTLIVASTPPLLFGKTDHPFYSIVPDMIDDLRDQWIHGANTDELETFLGFCERLGDRKRTTVVVLSGDIHIHHLVRCTREASNVPVLHQVTSSPIGNTPVGGLLERIVYGRGDLEGKTYPGSEFWGAIQEGTLISARGYAIVTWDAGSPQSLAVTWRVLESNGLIKSRGPFQMR